MRLPLVSFAAAAIALAATGCSDPAPVIPQGAWTVSFLGTAPDPMSHCMIAGHNVKVGDVSQDMRNSVMQDGDMGASVACSVVGTGTFQVQADMSFQTSHLNIELDQISKGANKASPVTGHVTYSSQNTAGNGYHDPSAKPCQFWFEDGTSEGIAEGKVWVSFKCDSVVQAMSTCEIKQGVALFENCSTKPPM